MAMVINSNIMSLNAQRNLMTSQNDLSTAMERLSSGKRINSAADDAAGLSITNKMTSQVRGLNQAIRNANDGISLIQTAEGALGESTNILQRMRELAIQSANGTYDSGNRTTLNAEVKQLKTELDRIADTTSFNGQKILDGSLGQVDLQVGSEAFETIALEIGKMDTKALGNGAGADVVGDLANDGTGTLFANLQGAIDGAAGGNAMYVNGQDVGDLTALAATDSLQNILDTMNTNITGVEIGSVVSWTADTVGDGIFQGDEGLQISFSGLDVADDQVGTNVQSVTIQNTGSMDELVSAINDQGQGLVTASINDDGKLNISSNTASQLIITASDDVSGGPGATGTAALGVSGLGILAADVGTVTQEAQLSFSTEAGVNNITVTYDDVTQADVTGVDSRVGAGVIQGYVAIADAGGADIEAGHVVINGVSLDKYDSAKNYDNDAADTADEATDIVAWINSHKEATGVVASLEQTIDGAVDGALKLSSIDGSEISIKLDDEQAATIEAKLGIQENNNASAGGSAVADIDISTANGAQKAIDVIDAALETISSTRGDLGAISNRLDFTINNLTNVSENVAAARSQIEDADFAAESAALSRAQVLQQAGTAMLAQANAQPQQVLSLLQ
ncbi:flagellin N-terminal helical domain-containing protein [Amphritea balenae]|uniref:Flagellin n=1 Tax=Amphritea balenae TaxID=452629 RepID=A0A3P1SSU4_9GAMM|nr:flagellin [Amphritea balenae]RRC99252.1 flagellar biosynthesis protein FliC [Amphritea balenae]GGK72725.1 flagellin [Amphritea balenae]